MPNFTVKLPKQLYFSSSNTHIVIIMTHLLCSSNLYNCNMSIFFWKQHCQTKICNLWIKKGVQQDVVGLDVSMNNSWIYACLQVMQTLCHSQTYVELCRPCNLLVTSVLCITKKIFIFIKLSIRLFEMQYLNVLPRQINFVKSYNVPNKVLARS